MRKVILFIIFLSGFGCREAFADFYFQQNVQVTQEKIREGSSEKSEQKFIRKIYVLGPLLVFQIEEEGLLKKEYGFDFKKNIYYEADPSTGYFKLFDLKILSEAFQKIALTSPARFQGSRQSVANNVSRSLVEGKADYRLRIHPAWFSPGTYGRHRASHYKLRAGPGTIFLNFFGWFRKADIWATQSVAGFSDYEAARALLETKATFYKIKQNRVSDLIVTLSKLKGVPLRVDSIAKRCYGPVVLKESTHELTSLISNSAIQHNQLLYYRDRSKFSWNVIFSQGTEFGPEASQASSEAFNMRRSAPWAVLPALFFIFSYVWFFGGYRDKDDFSSKKILVFRLYVLVSTLFFMEIIHAVTDLSFFKSPMFEFALASVLGVIWVVWSALAHRRHIKKMMAEAKLKFCPHCHARCEAFYIICPACNRDL